MNSEFSGAAPHLKIIIRIYLDKFGGSGIIVSGKDKGSEMYSGENKFVKALAIKYCKVRLYKDLTKNSQKAIFCYMQEGTWEECDTVADSIRNYGKTKFGYGRVPTPELCKACYANIQVSPVSDHDFVSFSDYNCWYLNQGNVIDHGKSVWPVILNDFPDEFLQDGWHRFHSYVAKKLKSIPVLYFSS
jgi:hypothetical protein